MMRKNNKGAKISKRNLVDVCVRGNVDMVKELLDNYQWSKNDFYDAFSSTIESIDPFDTSLENSRLEVLILILEEGKVERLKQVEKKREGYLLHKVCRTRSYAAIELFLTRGWHDRVNQVDGNKETPLLSYIETGNTKFDKPWNLDTLNILLLFGADCTAKGSSSPWSRVESILRRVYNRNYQRHIEPYKKLFQHYSNQRVRKLIQLYVQKAYHDLREIDHQAGRLRQSKREFDSLSEENEKIKSSLEESERMLEETVRKNLIERGGLEEQIKILQEKLEVEKKKSGGGGGVMKGYLMWVFVLISFCLLGWIVFGL